MAQRARGGSGRDRRAHVRVVGSEPSQRTWDCRAGRRVPLNRDRSRTSAAPGAVLRAHDPLHRHHDRRRRHPVLGCRPALPNSSCSADNPRWRSLVVFHQPLEHRLGHDAGIGMVGHVHEFVAGVHDRVNIRDNQSGCIPLIANAPERGRYLPTATFRIDRRAGPGDGAEGCHPAFDELSLRLLRHHAATVRHQKFHGVLPVAAQRLEPLSGAREGDERRVRATGRGDHDELLCREQAGLPTRHGTNVNPGANVPGIVKPGGAGGTRTPGLHSAIVALSQLSYSPVPTRRRIRMELMGLEPMTSTMPLWRSPN